MSRLKVFCTTSGFHDSIVAAPSRKAALEAWGARTDLFSMGAAEQVTDQELAIRALERPGEVIRIRRSGREELPAATRRNLEERSRKRPKRTRLEAAERKLAELEARSAKEAEAIARDMRSLEMRRDRLAARHAASRKHAEQMVEKAREEYEAALAQWEG